MPFQSLLVLAGYLEAWSHKKPIVALDLEAPTKHITPENGILVKKEDIREIEKALETLLSNPEKACYMGEKGYEKFKKDYELNSYIRRLVRIYHSAWMSGL